MFSLARWTQPKGTEQLSTVGLHCAPFRFIRMLTKGVCHAFCCCLVTFPLKSTQSLPLTRPHFLAWPSRLHRPPPPAFSPRAFTAELTVFLALPETHGLCLCLRTYKRCMPACFYLPCPSGSPLNILLMSHPSRHLSSVCVSRALLSLQGELNILLGSLSPVYIQTSLHHGLCYPIRPLRLCLTLASAWCPAGTR